KMCRRFDARIGVGGTFDLCHALGDFVVDGCLRRCTTGQCRQSQRHEEQEGKKSPHGSQLPAATSYRHACWAKMTASIGRKDQPGVRLPAKVKAFSGLEWYAISAKGILRCNC